MRRRPGVFLSVSLVTVLSVAGCGSGSAGTSPSSSGGSSPALSGRLTVFAAASLTEAFTTIGEQFEKAHPGTAVTFSFGPSSGLAQQILAGNPADVFASASPANLKQVVDGGAAGPSVTFARNRLQIAIPADNPGGITQLSDLARPGVTLAECQPQVPCGKLAATVLKNAKLSVKPVTLEVDVKGVLTKVRSAEVDAGLVYVTDVRTAGGKVRGIDIPDAVNASTAYPLAALKAAANPALAKAFVDYVSSPAGQGVLTADGFAAP